MKYKTIYLDPPWPETGGGKVIRGAQKHYSVMKVEDIVHLPVDWLADVNCHLYLWTTNGHLPWAFKCLTSWNFRYITTITWLKNTMSIGQYFRGQTEHCLFAIKGNLPYKFDSVTNE